MFWLFKCKIPNESFLNDVFIDDMMYSEIIEVLRKKNISKDKLSRLKNKLCKKHGVKKVPTDIEILLHADSKDIKWLKKKLLTKPVRTQSGVSVIAVMSYPHPCPHGACVMCPTMTEKGVPQSYTGKEPATRRGLRNKFDAYLQVFNRLEQYVVTGHNFDKIEIIVMGGTFLSFPKKYKEKFIIDIWQGLNDFSKKFIVDGELDIIKFKKFFELPGDIHDEERQKRVLNKVMKLKEKRNATLEGEKKYNDLHSHVKGIGMTIETRPDYGFLKHGNEMLKYGVTRVELGVQSAYDDVLKRIKRGHSAKDTIESIGQLRDLGFKLNFHMMPGLPGVSLEKDLEGLKEIFRDPRYRPDMLKIYPCMVVKDSELYQDYLKGKFKPLGTAQAAELIAEFKRYVPEYCRIMRVQRDIPTYCIEAGVDRTNLRQYVEKIMQEKEWKCRCIRCREVKNRELKGDVKIKIEHYDASKGKEFFISANIGDNLLGFCRLRFPYQGLRKEITVDCGLIRELHVYGSAIRIGKGGNVQHTGVGKRLMRLAENLAVCFGKQKLVVISGVGVRGYYRKLGYKLEGPYMCKNL